MSSTTTNRPDELKTARFIRSSNSIELSFSDKSFILPIEQLEMPVDRIDWPTLAASPTGEKMTVKGVKGDPVPIDSSTLRYLVDEEYAAQMDAKLASLQFTEDELDQLIRDNPPPTEWFAEPSHDFMRESWK